MTIITQTPRIIIREFLPDELETYLNHFNDERVIEHIPKRTRDERITIFNIALSEYTGSKTKGIWGMFYADSDEFIGSCLLRPFGDTSDKLELGYSLDHKDWGKGLASEMAKAMVNYGFSDSAITEIVACTTVENIPSQRVLENAGLKRDGNLLRGELDLPFFSLKR